MGADDPPACPDVSVIVPAYNPGSWLREALASIAQQNCPSLETILIDDGSTEALDFGDWDNALGLTCLRQDRRGPSAARNTGIRAARGDFLAFLDADDVWPVGALRVLLSGFRSEPETDIVHGHLRNLTVLRNPHGAMAELLGRPRLSFNLGSMLFRRRVFDRIGPLDETKQRSEDVDLLVRVAELGLIRRTITDTVLYYRRQGGGIIEALPLESRSLEHMGQWARILKHSLDRRRTK